MNSKKVNWLFLSIVLLHFLAVFLLGIFAAEENFGITANLLYSELIIMIPSVICYYAKKGNNRAQLGFHKMKISTVGMVVLFTFLTMPLTTVINAISMLFVDNAVMAISGDVLNTPFFIVFILMAVYGPFCEEFVFRGMIFRGYREDGGRLGAVCLSALLFGMIHMNFNQMPYAFAIGIFLALLVEAAGSLWSSVLYHFIFNAQSVCLMFLTEKMAPGMLEAGQETAADHSSMLYMIGIYLMIAAVTTAGAVCTLMWIARNENRADKLAAIFTKRETRGRMVTLPLAAAIIISLGYMLAMEIL